MYIFELSHYKQYIFNSYFRMYIWWIFLFLASKTVADQSGSDLANNGGESKLWLTDRADRIENVLLNLSNHVSMNEF